MKYAISFLLIPFLFSCVTPTYVNPGDISFSVKREDGKVAYSADESIMVIGLQQSNSILLMVEQALLSRGAKLVADPQVQTQVPAFQTQRVTSDTTITQTTLQPVVRQLHDAGAAKYILRYRYEGSKITLSAFNASLIEQSTGTIVASFSYNCRSTLHPRTQLVLKEFARRIIPDPK